MKESNLALYFPLDEEENATTVQDWGPYGLVGTVSGNPERFPGRNGSSFRFTQGAGMGISVKHHRSMRMGSKVLTPIMFGLEWKWVLKTLARLPGEKEEVQTEGNISFILETTIMPMEDTFITAFRILATGIMVVGNAYRVAVGAWTMVTVMNQGNPGVAKTYLNGAPIQSSVISQDVLVQQTTDFVIGNANLRASVQNVRLYNVALSDAEVAALYNSVDSESGTVVINVSNVIPFNAGVASVTQPTYTVPVSAYTPTWAASGLPAGLSINADTGAISGTASGTPANTGTDHAVSLFATNGYGKTTKSVIMKAYPMPSSITDGGAVDLGMYGATLTGSFADPTGTSCKVHFFVDTSDKGDSNVSAWAQHYVLENQTPGAFSRVLSGLTF